MLLRKRKIPLVMARHAHHRTRTITRHHKIACINRNFFIRQWMYRVLPNEKSVLLFISFQFFRSRHILNKLLVSLFIFRSFNKTFNALMLYRTCHKSHSVQRIRTRGENFERLLASLNRKYNLCPFASSNPVSLQLLHALRPFQFFKSLQQFIRIISNFQEPLLQKLNRRIAVASPALPRSNFFISKYCLARRTPVNRRLLAISNALLKHAQK